MAKAKSTSGSKTTSKTNTNTPNEQANVTNPASSPAVPAPVVQAPAVQAHNLQEKTHEKVQPNTQAVAPTAAPAAAKAEPKIAITPELRKKLEVVKSEPRRVVPINVEEEIRRRAYELYQQRGARPGGEREDWLAAEREVKQRYQQQQSA
jgi:hypothetical protein